MQLLSSSFFHAGSGVNVSGGGPEFRCGGGRDLVCWVGITSSVEIKTAVSMENLFRNAEWGMRNGEDKTQKTEDKTQKTEDKTQKTEDKTQKTEVKCKIQGKRNEDQGATTEN